MTIVAKSIQECASYYWKKRAWQFFMEHSRVPSDRYQYFSFSRLCSWSLPLANLAYFLCSIVTSNGTCFALWRTWTKLIALSEHRKVISRATEAFISYYRDIPPVDMSPCIEECTYSMPTIKLESSHWEVKDATGQLWSSTNFIVWSIYPYTMHWNSNAWNFKYS